MTQPDRDRARSADIALGAQQTALRYISAPQRLLRLFRVLLMASPREKEEWPELVDLPAEKAKAELEAKTKHKVHLVETGSAYTMDFRQDRVRIFYEKDTGKVIRPPRIG
ncbi:hypothetical protein WJX73_004035 [Symbiochloris irregularis]|uniref:Uncharacterized protein n=1 Tax=Symbiochloris irregularis TaxID=706552 RepID=A0AAW1PBU1_9CHLO